MKITKLLGPAVFDKLNPSQNVQTRPSVKILPIGLKHLFRLLPLCQFFAEYFAKIYKSHVRFVNCGAQLKGP